MIDFRIIRRSKTKFYTGTDLMWDENSSAGKYVRDNCKPLTVSFPTFSFDISSLETFQSEFSDILKWHFLSWNLSRWVFRHFHLTFPFLKPLKVSFRNFQITFPFLKPLKERFRQHQIKVSLKKCEKKFTNNKKR